MYILSILAIIVVTVLMVMMAGMGVVGLTYYLDLASIAVILLIAIPVLLSTGLGSYFNKAFGVALNKKKEYSLTDMKKSLEAVEVFMKAVFLSGLLSSFMSVVMIFAVWTESTKVGPSIAVAVITIIYALAIDLMLLPISTRIKVRMLECMHE